MPDVKNNQAYCAFYHYPVVAKDYVFPAKLLPSTYHSCVFLLAWLCVLCRVRGF
jgi:hypothetical protein